MGELNFDQELIHKVEKTATALAALVTDHGLVPPAGAVLALALCANRAERFSALLLQGISARRGISAGIVRSRCPSGPPGSILQQEELVAPAVYP